MVLEATYSWRQSARSVVVEVPLKGAPAKAVDIVATELMIKISFEQYLLHLDLIEAIEDSSCVAKIKHGILSLKLTKKVPGSTWPSLVVSGMSKQELKARRSKALEEKAARDTELAERAKDRKIEDERKALRKQMALEEDERQHIDDLKQEEKENAEQEVYKALAEIEAGKKSKQPVNSDRLKGKTSSAQSNSHRELAGGGVDNDSDPAHDDPNEDSAMVQELLTAHDASTPKTPGPAPTGGPSEEAVDAMLAELEREEVATEKEAASAERRPKRNTELALVGRKGAPLDADADATAQSKQPLVRENDDDEYEMVELHEGYDLEENSFVPDPRNGGGGHVVKFNFTPRIFPTPMRESKALEEEDWVAKNRTHLRKNPQLKPQLDALDIEDSDPTWLKGKGDDFYRARDYRAAVNAYTTALELQPEHLAVLGNRSACYLQLGELVRCVEDCGAMLDALDKEAMSVDANPSDPTKLGMRLKALCRRGTAKCQQGLYREALQDYHQAVNLNPTDPALTADLRRVFSLTKCEDLKKQADAKLGAGDLAAARELYTEALSAEPGFVSALSNRAACHLASGCLLECADDCSAALDLLEVDPGLAAVTEMHLLSGMGAPAYPAKVDHQPSAGGGSPLVPTGPVPPVGSQKRRTWVLKTVARRGLAYAKLGRLAEAIEDYTLALSLTGEEEEKASDGTGAAAVVSPAQLLRNDLAALQAQLLKEQEQEEAREGQLRAVQNESPEEKGEEEEVKATKLLESDAAPPPSPTPPPQSQPFPATPDSAATVTTKHHQQQQQEQQEKVESAPSLPDPPAQPRMEVVPGFSSRRCTLVEGRDKSRCVKRGSTVRVHAKGVLKESGACFWNTRSMATISQPFQYTAGVGNVIQGWDQGCLGMCVGETRVVEIPPSEGYGAAGFPAWSIPGNATLLFTLECLSIQ